MEVVVQGSPVKEKDKKEASPDKWEIDCWVRTLTEAEEIKADAEKMKHVLPRLKKQVKVIESLEELRKKASEMAGESE